MVSPSPDHRFHKEDTPPKSKPKLRQVAVPVMMIVSIAADDDLESICNAERFLKTVPEFKSQLGSCHIGHVIGAIDITNQP